MTGTQIALIVAGVLALAVIARWLRVNEARISHAAQARERAEQMLAGFVAHGALVGTDGSAALVAGTFGSAANAQGGAIALLTRRGAKVTARRLIPPVRLSQAIEGVRVASDDSPFGGVLLFGVVVDEVRALEASVLRAATYH